MKRKAHRQRARGEGWKQTLRLKGGMTSTGMDRQVKKRENNGMKTKEAGVCREGGTKGGWMEVGQEERLRREGDMWRDGRT